MVFRLSLRAQAREQRLEDVAMTPEIRRALRVIDRWVARSAVDRVCLSELENQQTNEAA